MKSINQYIELKSEKLAENPFCNWLTEGSKNLSSYQDVFCFTPNMLYFILGFKDILSYLEYADPKTELEHYINVHCLEDRNHWMWYLQDLKTLGYTDSINNWSDFIKNIWNDDNKPTRDLVYLSIYYIKKFNNPIASLTIIECMESTFGVFMNCINKRFSKTNIYQKLQFFGQTHNDQEMNHSLGHWIDDGHKHTEHSVFDSLVIDEAQKSELILMIDQIYNQFNLVFETWLKTKESFTSPQIDNKHLAQSIELN